MPTNQAFAQFLFTQREHGIRPALAFLNSLTEHRFVGIWRFRDGKANAALHFDRLNPTQERAEEVPDSATYCTFIKKEGTPFRTASALLDERLAEHPARDTVQTYCGVPILGPGGTVAATLCFYDLVPREVDQIDLKLMAIVSSYLSSAGLVPPYPD